MDWPWWVALLQPIGWALTVIVALLGLPFAIKRFLRWWRRRETTKPTEAAKPAAAAPAETKPAAKAGIEAA